MKLIKSIFIVASALFLASCSSEWTEPERNIQENQKDLKRLIPFLEMKTEADLTPTLRKHYEQIREYRKTPHVKGFGWFGNWTAKGSNPMSYLKALPDSVDFVSLWGTRGALTEDQKADLEFFQKIKGGKALLCWIVQDVGDQLTPAGMKQEDYWLKEKGQGDPMKAVVAYADAIADTIQKYNFDGFDIDFEPTYGHSSRNNNMPISQGAVASIAPDKGNKYMYTFIKHLRDRFAKMEGEKLLVFDGQPECLSTEASKMIDYYIYQAYWESYSNSVINKVTIPHLHRYEDKTIITVEFEQTWRTGGIHPQSGSSKGTGRMRYNSSKYPELSGKPGAQIFDYATLDFPSGKRIAGIGSYHMEYDVLDMPYKWLRAALDRANKEIPGKF